MMHSRSRIGVVALAFVAALLHLVGGCSALENVDLSGILSDALNSAFDSNANSNDNGSSIGNDAAAAVFFVRGRPIGGYVSATFAVTDLEFIGSDDKTIARLVLSTPTVIDLLSEDLSSFLACTDIAPVGTFTKLRLTVSDAALVTTAGLQIDSSLINLPANGKLDLNTQSRKFSIHTNTLNILEFDLTSDDNTWSLGAAANGRVNINAEALTTTRSTLGATGRFSGLVVSSDGVSDLVMDTSNCQLAVRATDATEIRRSSGGTLTFGDLEANATIIVEASFAPDHLLVASRITLVESE